MKKQAGSVVYLSFGSNLGDRRAYIEQALEILCANSHIKVLKVSSIIETIPQGGPKQGNFLNGVIAVTTTLTPAGLLGFLQSVEKKLGRKRTVRFGPRTIDLDILLWGDKIIRTKRLTVPHPRMFERDFVLGPLVEIYAGNIKSSLRTTSRKGCRTKK